MAGSTVLVVDDEPRIVEFLTENLRDDDFTVLTAATGADAIELLGRARPHLFSIALAEGEERRRLASYEVVDDILALAAQQRCELLCLAKHVRVERASETAVRREDDDRSALDLLGLGGQDVVDVRERRNSRYRTRDGA